MYNLNSTDKRNGLHRAAGRLLQQRTNSYFNLIGDAYFWSSNATTAASAPCCALTHSCPVILITDNNKDYGYSVRCIKYKKFDY